jgi:hypothetical protein
MRVTIGESSVRVDLSADDTRAWAKGRAKWGGGSWPCSVLSYSCVWGEFDANGLTGYAVDCRVIRDLPTDEFNAIMADALKGQLPEGHPCYFVVMGQFLGK